MRKWGWRVLAAAAGLSASAPASAEWMQATTRHFIVYADGSDKEVTKLATDLEQVDAVMRLLHNVPDTPEAASNPLTVYVLSDVAAVQRLCRCPNVAGFYDGRASGSVAFTPKRSGGGEPWQLSPRIVLFHEYAHHFLLGNYARAYPAWYSEGYAEFASTIRQDKTSYLVGAPANHRAYGLFNTDMPIELLFDPARRKALSDQQLDAIYGRGWLLTHYLLFDQARGDQLYRYITALNNGTPSLTAARNAFGDLQALDRALDKYRDSPRLAAARIPLDRIATPRVALRPLTAGEAALIDLRIVSDRGVDEKLAATTFQRAAKAAAKYPGDAVAQGWLAEMAFDAGDDAAAEAAADRALALDPDQRQALLYKARVRLRLAGKAKADAKAWTEARAYIIRANRRDPDVALPLVLFYGSFELEGRAPTKSAIAGLYRAQQLAPQDDGLRWAAAGQRIDDGDLDAARRLLRPLAFNPHLKADNPAATLLTALDKGKDSPELRAAIAAGKKKAQTEGEGDKKP